MSGVTLALSMMLVSRSVSNRDPITAAAFRVCLAAWSRRSMRAPMVACRVAGTVNAATSPRSR